MYQENALVQYFQLIFVNRFFTEKIIYIQEQNSKARSADKQLSGLKLCSPVEHKLNLIQNHSKAKDKSILQFLLFDSDISYTLILLRALRGSPHARAGETAGMLGQKLCLPNLLTSNPPLSTKMKKLLLLLFSLPSQS